MLLVPEEFAEWRSWQSGVDGRRWIEALPDLVHGLVDEWELRPTGEPPMYGAVGLVLPVTRAGEPCVLKVSWPDPTSVDAAAALRIWDGNGAVRLFDESAERHAVLLERLDSTRSLRGLPLFEAAEQAGAVARVLTVPAPSGFRVLADIAIEFVEAATVRQRELGGPVPTSWLDRAVGLAGELAVDAGSDLVHADLHYENVLASDRAPWLAIDPKPVAGEPEFCVPELMWTRLDEAVDADAVRRLLAVLVAAGELDPERARAWTVVRAIDYWLWGLAAGLTEDPVRCRRLVETLCPDLPSD